MNKRITTLSKLALTLTLTAMLGLFASSCTTENNGPTTTTNPPSGIAVTSASSSSIRVMWTANVATPGTATITATPPVPGSAVTASVSSVQGMNMANITGLSENVKYTITVTDAGGTSTDNAVWATAARSGSVRIYETADPSDPSGLVLNPEDAALSGSPSTVAQSASVAAGSAGQGRVDLVLISDVTNHQDSITLVSPDVTGTGITTSARVTTIAREAHTVQNGLDNDFYTNPSSSDNNGVVGKFGVNDRNAVEIPGNIAIDSSLILFVKLANGYYARVAILPNSSTGKYYGVTTVNGFNYYYVDVVASVQRHQGWGYVSRPTIHNGISNAVKNAAVVTPKSKPTPFPF